MPSRPSPRHQSNRTGFQTLEISLQRTKTCTTPSSLVSINLCDEILWIVPSGYRHDRQLHDGDRHERFKSRATCLHIHQIHKGVRQTFDLFLIHPTPLTTKSLQPFTLSFPIVPSNTMRLPSYLGALASVLALTSACTLSKHPSHDGRPFPRSHVA